MSPKLNELLLAILRFVWPFANAKTKEIVGTVVTCLAIVGAVASQVLPYFVAVPTPTVVVGDVVTVPADVPVPAPAEPAPTPNPPDAVEPAEGAVPDVPPRVSSVGEILFAALTAPLGCSGPQREDWLEGARAAGDCAVKCAVPTGTYALTQTIHGVELDGPGLTKGLLSCLVPCLAAVAVTTVTKVVSEPTRYGGSAGEANVYKPDTYRILLTPPK
jgi:hypothetical protein